jgi:hypothetical protein
MRTQEVNKAREVDRERTVISFRRQPARRRQGFASDGFGAKIMAGGKGRRTEQTRSTF